MNRHCLSVGLPWRSVVGQGALPPPHQEFDGIRKMLPVNVMIASDNAELVCFDHDVSMSAAFRGFKAITCKLQPEAQWVPKVD